MKIGFTGTMSVGKTTLVNALKELPEFKDYSFKTERSKYLRDLGIPLNTDSSTKGQIIFLAERCSELYDENIIDIEDNGVRTTDPEYRKSVNKEIKKIIKEKKGYIKNLIELNGSVEERVNKVKQTLSL